MIGTTNNPLNTATLPRPTTGLAALNAPAQRNTSAQRNALNFAMSPAAAAPSATNKTAPPAFAGARFDLNSAKIPVADGVAALNAGPSTTEHDQLTEQAQKWVGLTFFGTMLKQMRDDPFKSELFDGGRGGEMFQSLYDQRLADHMSKGAGKKLVNAIVKKIEASRAYSAQNRGKKSGGSNGESSLNASGSQTNVPTNLRA